METHQILESENIGMPIQSGYRNVEQDNNAEINEIMDPQLNQTEERQFGHEQQYSDHNLEDANLNQDQKSLIQTFYQIKKDKKIAEKNSEMLANRISLLKQEEMRTLKKIEETRKKALEIYFLKLKNEQRNEQKKQIKESTKLEPFNKSKSVQKGLNIRAKSRELYLEKDRTLNKVQLQEIKASQAETIKKERDLNKKKIEEKRVNELLKAQERKKALQEQQKQKREQISQQLESKKNKIQQELEDKSKKERQEFIRKQNEIKRMEEYELEMIQRLQQTQTMQKKAYEELENALMLQPQSFAEKYLTNQQQKQENENEKKPSSGSKQDAPNFEIKN